MALEGSRGLAKAIHLVDVSYFSLDQSYCWNGERRTPSAVNLEIRCC